MPHHVKVFALSIIALLILGFVALPGLGVDPASAETAVTPTLVARAWAYLPAVHGLLAGPTITPELPLPTATGTATFAPSPTETTVATATNSPKPPTATNSPQPPTATNTPNLPTATNTPKPPTATNTPNPPTATNTPKPPTKTPKPPTPTNTPKPPPPTGCGTCAYDAYNCSDFARQVDAQACFDYCWDETGRDVHRLDADGDMIACETLPLIQSFQTHLSSGG